MSSPTCNHALVLLGAGEVILGIDDGFKVGVKDGKGDGITLGPLLGTDDGITLGIDDGIKDGVEESSFSHPLVDLHMYAISLGATTPSSMYRLGIVATASHCIQSEKEAVASCIWRMGGRFDPPAATSTRLIRASPRSTAETTASRPNTAIMRFLLKEVLFSIILISFAMFRTSSLEKVLSSSTLYLSMTECTFMIDVYKRASFLM